jgi:glycosyltransferase involved in cell wall biosynthesis
MATRVSVCIPSYNASRLIGKTIASVLNSTYSDFELIVNDDASTDDTREVVSSFHDERIRFFRNETNLGVPANWNRALERASGEFIGLLNHDDLLGLSWLTFAVHALEKYLHIGWVATAFRVSNENDQTLQIISRFPHTGEQNRRDVFLCLAQFIGLGPFYLVRRQVLQDVGYYDVCAGPSADTDLFLRLLLKYPLYYSSYPHVTKRQHSSNLARQANLPETTARCLTILNKAFSNTNLPQELRDCERTCFIHLYRQVVAGAKVLLERGDLESIQRTFHVLSSVGYGSWQ